MATVQSMTAFARNSEQGKWGSITLEIRSVNHRYLDCNFKLPETSRKLEPKLRDLTKQLGRGRIECFLRHQPGEAAISQLSINKNLVKQLSAATVEVSKYFNGTTAFVNPMHVLSWNNILQIENIESELIDKKILHLFEKTIKELITVRNKEGAALKQLLIDKLKVLSLEVKKIKKLLPAIIRQKRDSILFQLEEIQGELDQTRLEQEMVYFVQRNDIEEETDRLETHVQETIRILKQGGTIGKRLDFLMQELNREANTLASKSSDKTTTHAAIELKVLIEQMREQVQNIA